MVEVYRVREVNGHRLTSVEAADHPEAIVWRVISAARRYGAWTYLFDDPVIEANVGRYFRVSADRGAERISLHRLGTVLEVLERGTMDPMRGTVSLAREAKLVKLEAFL